MGKKYITENEFINKKPPTDDLVILANTNGISAVMCSPCLALLINCTVLEYLSHHIIILSYKNSTYCNSHL